MRYDLDRAARLALSDLLLPPHSIRPQEYPLTKRGAVRSVDDTLTPSKDKP